ncbi:MAG: hypothetical protein R3F19_34275 [Verrucomicrobiales bacterium]
MNEAGHLIWTESVITDPAFGKSRMTTNILRPVERQYFRENIDQYPAPVSGNAKPYRIGPINNNDQFSMVEQTNGAAFAFFFDGGSYHSINNPYDFDTNNPPTYDRTDPSFLWKGTVITAISDGGIMAGIIETRGRDFPPSFPVSFYRSGIYTWKTPLDFQKQYELPDPLLNLDLAGGPNASGTTIFKDRSNPGKTYYNRSGTLEEVAGIDNDIIGFNNKDQIFGRNFIYLPEEDYGLPVGITKFDDTKWLIPTESDFLYRSSLTSEFEVFEEGAWQKMNLVDPAKPGFVPNIGLRIYGINRDGDLLVGDIRPVDGVNVHTVMLLERADNIRATVMMVPREIAVGEPFNMNVAIKNTSDLPFVLTGVLAEGFKVLGTAAGGLVQLDNPPPSNSLAPGATFVQRFVWQGNSAGKVQFAFKCTGVFPDGNPNITPELVTAEVQVGGDPIKIEFETLPKVPRKPPEDLEAVSIVNMNVFEDTVNEGKFIVTDKIPGAEFDSVISPKVKVKITNVWEKKTPVTAIIQRIDTKARDRTPLGARAKLLGTFPIDLGTIPYGESVEREFALDIRDDGRFEFAALATSIPTGTTDQYNTAETGSPIAVGDPFPVEIELKFNRTPDITYNKNGAFFIRPGSSLKILATVTNNTTNSTLNFNGIVPEAPDLSKPKGNAFGGILTSEIANGFNPPFAHDHEIPSGSFVVLSTDILTDPLGAGSGQITWDLPHGDHVILVDDVSKEETEVEEEDILVKSELGSWGGDPLSIKIFQDNNLPAVPILTATETVANFTGNAIIGMGEWTHDSFAGLGSLGDAVVSDPTAMLRVMGSGAQSMYQWAEMAAITWNNMTPEERLEFAQSVADEVPERAALLHFTGQPFTPEEILAVKQAARDATYVFFMDVENAYASQDPLQISAVLGNISGKAALEIATSGVPTPKWTKFTRGVEALRLQTNAKAANLFTEVEQYLRKVKGPVSFYHARKYWGIGGRELQAVQEVLGALGMKGYARERSPRAIHLIEQLKEALWKPELMKPKGISEVDRLLLGDEKVALLNSRLKSVNDPTKQIDIDGITAIFKPDSEQEILTRLNNLPPDRRLTEEGINAVLERRKQRLEEYNDYRAKFQEWKEDGLPVAFNYDGNVAKAPADITAAANRAFDFEDIGTIGNPVLIPKMADKGGILKYISGDVDWIHFSWLDGTPLDAETAGKLYTILSRCCGLQHGETMTWFNKGQTVFKGKLNQIGEYLRGQKALLEVTGDSLRAVHLDPILTMFAPDGRSHLIFFDAGTKVLRQLRDKAKVTNFLINIAELSRVRYSLVPGNWYENLSAEDNSIGGKEYSITDQEGALMVRKSVDGEPEVFNGTSWLPLDINSIIGEAALSPLTKVSEDAKAGSTKLEVFDLSLLAGDELAGRINSWFKPGQRIVIAPGENKQEIHVVKDLGSLILENPLQYDHPAGTLVSVVPPGMKVEESGNEDSLKILFSEWSSNGKELTITWSSVTNVEYLVETTNSLKADDWTPVGGSVTANSSTTTLTLTLPGGTDRMFYRLRRVGN